MPRSLALLSLPYRRMDVAVYICTMFVFKCANSWQLVKMYSLPERKISETKYYVRIFDEFNLFIYLSERPDSRNRSNSIACAHLLCLPIESSEIDAMTYWLPSAACTHTIRRRNSNFDFFIRDFWRNTVPHWRLSHGNPSIYIPRTKMRDHFYLSFHSTKSLSFSQFVSCIITHICSFQICRNARRLTFNYTVMTALYCAGDLCSCLCQLWINLFISIVYLECRHCANESKYRCNPFGVHVQLKSNLRLQQQNIINLSLSIVADVSVNAYLYKYIHMKIKIKNRQIENPSCVSCI